MRAIKRKLILYKRNLAAEDDLFPVHSDTLHWAHQYQRTKQKQILIVKLKSIASNPC